MLSSTAASLFWLGRYVERAENNSRLLDVNSQMLLDLENRSEETERQFWLPILSTLEDTELFRQLHPEFTAAAVLDALCRDAELQRRWSDLQLVGDALRSTEVAACHVDGFCDRVRKSLRNILAPDYRFVDMCRALASTRTL